MKRTGAHARNLGFFIKTGKVSLHSWVLSAKHLRDEWLDVCANVVYLSNGQGVKRQVCACPISELMHVSRGCWTYACELRVWTYAYELRVLDLCMAAEGAAL